MNLEVIGASFGRTGTMSMKAALEELGFGSCYHMRELFEHPEHIGQWRAPMRGEPVDWERILGDYRATVDWPGCSFYDELLERNPDAKVILTVRDPQRWYESALKPCRHDPSSICRSTICPGSGIRVGLLMRGSSGRFT